MYTNKRELTAALKLASSSKTQKWPAFVRFKASARGLKSADEAPVSGESAETAARRAAREDKEAELYLGRGLMQTTCGLWESEFYFRAAWSGEQIDVSLGALENAVKTLGNGEIELISRGGFLYIWQARECIKISAQVFSEEIKKQLPATTLRELNRGMERWLNIYEFSGIISILKKILIFAAKSDFGQSWDSVYFENRACAGEGYEDLFLAAYDGGAVAVGRQIVERLGGFGIFLLPANAARKICAAAKLLSPEGMLLRLDNNIVSFEIGRAIISARLIEADFVNPELARPRDIIAAFSLDKAQLARFAKKAKTALSKITFAYEDGILSAAAGCANYAAQGHISVGQDSQPLESCFEFELSAARLVDILSVITAETLNLYYAGDKRLLYITADNINYAVMPENINDKKDKQNEK